MVKISKGKLIAAGILCAALAVTYFAGGGYAAKESSSEKVPAARSSEKTETTSSAVTSFAFNANTASGSGICSNDSSSEGVVEGSEEYSQEKGMEIDPETGKDQYLTDPVPEGKPTPVEPQNSVITEHKLTCTFSVRCDTILDNFDALDPEKKEIVPGDGIIFAAQKVDFYEGESVFNVLLREMKKSKIHMEFVNTPIYNSAYIEGINNLYEFDCGELSGWMYKVNGWFPNYGCSRYQLKDGDVVEWVYTCDLGRDVDGYYSTGGE
jgi:hypothetical protein